ncbi:multiple sugar transport system permease protein [Pararobbsia alpina]|uniref:carbohydrate ABC transporter permease n=1 Tax=Pararobbsia alpina TaxID=621374 RepID=UPI0039A4B20D
MNTRVTFAAVLATLSTLALAVVWVLPLLWAASTALRPEEQTVITPLQWLPHPVVFGAFAHVLSVGNLPMWFVNSAVTAIAVTLITIVISLTAAYAFSQLRFVGGNTLFWLAMVGFMFPFEALLIPLFREMHSFGLTNTLAGIVLPQVVSPVAIFVFKQFFDQIPKDFKEAAVLDGASEWSVLFRVFLPLSKNIVYAVAIVVFIGAWNNFLWPFIIVTTPNMMTVPVGLTQVQDAYGVRYASDMAAALLGGIPVAMAYLIFQRRVTQGFLAATGLKG